MKFYYLLGRIIRLPLALVFYLYCVLTKTPRVRVVAKNEKGELLLVKSWMSGGEWSFPGGGVDQGESYEAAACRELREETGIIAAEHQLTSLGSIHTWGHEEILFSLQIPGEHLPESLPDQYEIKDAAWFSAAVLPKLGSLAGQIIKKVDTTR